jgi:hypothetical protein
LASTAASPNETSKAASGSRRSPAKARSIGGG